MTVEDAHDEEVDWQRQRVKKLVAERLQRGVDHVARLRDEAERDAGRPRSAECRRCNIEHAVNRPRHAGREGADEHGRRLALVAKAELSTEQSKLVRDSQRLVDLSVAGRQPLGAMLPRDARRGGMPRMPVPT